MNLKFIVWKDCQHTQRLIGRRMPNFVFIVRLEIPGDDSPPAVIVATLSTTRGKKRAKCLDFFLSF